MLNIRNSIKEAIVDLEDLQRLVRYSWFLNGKTITTRMDNKTVSLASYILNIETNYYIQVDHKDLDIFNNQKANLRIATASQNAANRRSKPNKLGIRGVSSKASGKYTVQIQVRGRKLHIGTFSSIKDAARAYNKAAIKYFGEFAMLNKIND